MPELSAIPLADVLRAANELVSAGLIEDYALGGALAAIYYVEPFTTYDADIIFVTKDKTLSAGIRASNSWRKLRSTRRCWTTFCVGNNLKLPKP